MTYGGGTAARPRRRYIDWARGTAVLLMIEAHALDAWTCAASKSGFWFTQLSILGGFAAPTFLWLAGLSLVLSAERTVERSGSRSTAMHAIIRRGAEIFILAFLFRLQAFIVSPGSWLITIFRVDILNVLGLAIGAAGVVWGMARRPTIAAAVLGVAAVAVAMITPVVRAAGWVNLLPLWLQWHLRPFGDHTTFTLLPWAGFVFAGASAGSLLTLVRDEAGERRLLGTLGIAGLGLVWLGFYTATLPSLYSASFFWTSSPTFFAIRVGVILAALALLFAIGAWGRWPLPGLHVLEAFGRNSLFIYWIHVELVYGYATWAIHRRLSLSGVALGSSSSPPPCTQPSGCAIGWSTSGG